MSAAECHRSLPLGVLTWPIPPSPTQKEKENKYPLGWKPPPSTGSAGVLPKKEAAKVDGGGGGGLSYHNINTAVVASEEEGHQVVEEEGHQVVEEEAHQAFEGDAHQAAEEAGGGGSAAGPASPERVVPTCVGDNSFDCR